MYCLQYGTNNIILKNAYVYFDLCLILSRSQADHGPHLEDHPFIIASFY